MPAPKPKRKSETERAAEGARSRRQTVRPAAAHAAAAPASPRSAPGAAREATGMTVVAELLLEAGLYKRELLERMFGVTALAAAGMPARARTSAIPPGSNILGVGYGARQGGGEAAAGLAVRVYVKSKQPMRDLAESERVPAEVNGTPTDVIAVGELVALARPVKCGASVGHFAITAGTLGCLVRRGDDPDSANPMHFILSNNHVLANANAAAPQDPILEPGPTDGGDPNNPIARLTDFEPLDFGGKPNRIDAAIAQVIVPGTVLPALLKIGAMQSAPMAPALYQSVRKYGRTTLHTVGVMVDVAADVRVRYGTKFAEFEDQLAVVGAGGPFSSDGDSGSLVVDAVTRRPVGLLFAGGINQTFVNPIDPVLARFDVTIL